MMNTFSYSRLNLYQTCPRQFYLKYVEGKVETSEEPAVLGTAVHRYIELKLNGEADPMPIVLKEAALPLKEADVKKLATHYLKKHQTTPHQRTEGRLVHPIGTRGAQFQGFIDLFDESDQIPLITDFKTGRVIYEPHETMQLRMYAWLVSKVYGYTEVKARLWFNREAYVRCEKHAHYTETDLQEAEQWATALIDEIEVGLTAVDLQLAQPLEAFAPKHGHACDSCPFAKHCRPDLVALPDEIKCQASAQEAAAKIIVLERALEQVKSQLKEFVETHGNVRVGDEEFGFRSGSPKWAFPFEETKEALEGLGENPITFMKWDTDLLTKLLSEKPEASILREIATVKAPTRTFVHKKAGESA